MKYLIYILLIIILLCACNNSIHYTIYHEGFTPKIRQIYRPHVRNARILVEGFYNDYKKSITNYLKKYKII